MTWRCAEVRKQYNVSDSLLMWLPFRVPNEISIIDAKAITNPQAIILILRECLNPDNPMLIGLADLHSRKTFIDNLYDRLALYALPVLQSRLIDPQTVVQR